MRAVPTNWGEKLKMAHTPTKPPERPDVPKLVREWFAANPRATDTEVNEFMLRITEAYPRDVASWLGLIIRGRGHEILRKLNAAS